jgi:hypothetical protein
LGIRYVRLTGPHSWRQRKERGLGEGWLSSSVLQGEEKEENGEACWGGHRRGADLGWIGGPLHFAASSLHHGPLLVLSGVWKSGLRCCVLTCTWTCVARGVLVHTLGDFCADA